MAIQQRDEEVKAWSLSCLGTELRHLFLASTQRRLNLSRTELQPEICTSLFILGRSKVAHISSTLSIVCKYQCFLEKCHIQGVGTMYKT